jgi:hypothetical protein
MGQVFCGDHPGELQPDDGQHLYVPHKWHQPYPGNQVNSHG